MTILNDLVFSYEVAGASLFLALLNDARVIFWMLALMSATWSMITLAAGGRSEAFLIHFARHLLFFGLFGGLFLEFFPLYIGHVPELLQSAGFQAMGNDTFFNPDAILEAGFGLAMRMMKSTGNFVLMSPPGVAIRAVAAIVIMAAFVVIAVRVTQVLIEKSIAVLGIGVLLFAFTGSRWTWSIGEGLIRYAIHLGLRLLLLIILLDVGSSLVPVWLDAFDTPLGFLSVRVWLGLLVGPVVFAYIVWTTPNRVADQLAHRISIPNPHGAA